MTSGKPASSGSGERPEQPQSAFDLRHVLTVEQEEIIASRKNRGMNPGGEAMPGVDRSLGSANTPNPRNEGKQAQEDKSVAADPHWDELIKKAHEMKLVGLAFSGGGIRSATFNLGVLQGLAEMNFLRRFDFLSTVSGGGYIGSWLTSWLCRSKMDTVTQGLTPKRADQKGYQEPHEIRFLREYSNYLTPELGLFGADTWTMIANYLRNTLLNLVILILALSAILLLPWIGAALSARMWNFPAESFRIALAILAVCITFITLNMASRIFYPKRKFAPFTVQGYVIFSVVLLAVAAWFIGGWLWPDKLLVLRRPQTLVEWAEAGAIGYTFLWMFGGVAGVLLSLMWPPGANASFRDCNTPKSSKEEDSEQQASPSKPRIVLRVLVTVLTAAILAWVFDLAANPLQAWTSPGHSHARFAISLTVLLTVVFWGLWAIAPYSAERGRHLPGWLLGSAAALFGAPYAGALAGALLGAVQTLFNGWRGHHDLLFSAFGALLVLNIFLLAGTLHIGLMGLCLTNQKREWWNRLGAWVLIFALAWTGLCVLSLYSPIVWKIFRDAWPRLAALSKYSSIIIWIATTIGGLAAGRSKSTGKANGTSSLEWIAKPAPYVFIVGLLIVLSTQIYHLLINLSGHLRAPQALAEFIRSGTIAPLATGTPWYSRGDGIATWLIAATLILIGVALFLASRVDINEFCMHLFYRNRLVRCYLGAAQGPDRRSHPFTGFDAQDDLLLSSIDAKKSFSGPYPILNAALNLVHGKELAWQERMAESFILTPKFCGFDVWLEKLDTSQLKRKSDKEQHDGGNESESGQAVDAGDRDFGYRPTSSYCFKGGGILLGAAAGISGAAVSPNMGYHSSIPVAFLMTLFNVRLGVWAGNPRRKETWQKSGPTIGLLYLVKELFAQTDDRSKFVYLSDGGHFDNLGLYELVKRRCGLIVACDAEEDHGLTFGGLASAIRKCREDMGIAIEIDTRKIHLVKDSPWSQLHCAIGDIHYEMADPGAPTGKLIYFKASLTGDEPTDVLNYKSIHDDFPHQSTGEQWFSESQFESYRELGYHTVRSTIFDWGPLRAPIYEILKDFGFPST